MNGMTGVEKQDFERHLPLGLRTLLTLARERGSAQLHAYEADFLSAYLRDPSQAGVAPRG
jgi:hypothetical protein